MEFWKKNKWKIIAPVLIVLVLAVAFVFGDKNIPEQKDPTEQPGISAPAQPTQDDEMPEEPDDTATPEDTETATEDVPAPSNEQTADEAEKVDIDRSEFMTPEEMGAGATGEYEEVNGMMIDTGTGLDKYFTSPVPEGKPAPREPEDVELGTEEWTCTLSISCATILDNEKLCAPEKWELVPKDGWILEPVDYDPSKKYPAILNVHGGPKKMYSTFSSVPASSKKSIWNFRTRPHITPRILRASIICMNLTWVRALAGYMPSTAGSRTMVAAGITRRMAT